MTRPTLPTTPKNQKSLVVRRSDRRLDDGLPSVTVDVSNCRTAVKPPVLDTPIPFTLGPGNGGGDVSNFANLLASVDSEYVVEKPAKQSSLGKIAQSSSHEKKHTDQNLEGDQVDHSYKLQMKQLRAAGDLLPNERIAQCLRKVAPQASHVAGTYNDETRGAGYRNLVHCDSSSCPHCGKLRAESDRRELVAATANAQKMGLFVQLWTLTAEHHLYGLVKPMMQKMQQAYGSAFSGRWYADLRAEYGIRGFVKAWECTCGCNGWHPHIHVLVFMDLELVGVHIEALRDQLSERWRAALVKVGLRASDRRGVDVKAGDAGAAEYIAKYGKEPSDRTWGIEDEVGRVGTKRAGRGGLTPLQLLAVHAGIDDEARSQFVDVHPGLKDVDDQGVRAVAGDLWVEHFDAMKGRARLYWSPGLKELLKVDETVKALAVADDMSAYQHDRVLIDREEWKKVAPYDPALKDLRADLKRAIRTNDDAIIQAFLDRYGIVATIIPYAPTGEIPQLTVSLGAAATSRSNEPDRLGMLSGGIIPADCPVGSMRQVRGSGAGGAVDAARAAPVPKQIALFDLKSAWVYT